MGVNCSIGTVWEDGGRGCWQNPVKTPNIHIPHKILPVDVYLSEPEDFVLNEKKELRAPLCSLPGLGLSAAQNLKRIRQEGPFTSQEDMIRRKVSKSVVDMLRSVGALGDMPESSQVSLFDFGAI